MTTMEDFIQAHKSQLDALHIPAPLYEDLKRQLEAIFSPGCHCGGGHMIEGEEERKKDFEKNLVTAPLQLLEERFANCRNSPTSCSHGSILVVPHICSWDMMDDAENHDPRGMWNALSKLDDAVLTRIRDGLHRLWNNEKSNNTSLCTTTTTVSSPSSDTATTSTTCWSRNDLLEDICQPKTWSHVILYRPERNTTSGTGVRVRAALPSPPYYPQVPFDSAEEFATKEAELTGPFLFQYYYNSNSNSGHHHQQRKQKQNASISTSLVYLSPGVTIDSPTKTTRLPTLDLVPSYTGPKELLRSVRHVGLLLDHYPSDQISTYCLQQVKEYYEGFQSALKTIGQQKAKAAAAAVAAVEVRPSSQPQQHDVDADVHAAYTTTTPVLLEQEALFKVYTDASDPMGLAHPVAGLTDPHFQLVDSIAEADIVFSYQSLFAPGTPVKLALDARQQHHQQQQRNPVLINQFPYEGAFVQKDHLARELWNQYGLPRPSWAIEAYDLDVQLAAFVGAAARYKERGDDPVWIVKPARGTQSKGHLVTRSTAHILRLLDSSSTSRVVQRYIEKPVCFLDRKLDCRCIVLMTDATPGQPTLYMHNRVFLRIANKAHAIAKPSDLLDPEKVLTATHLFDKNERSSDNPLQLLPVDFKTIAHLEEEYGFVWKTDVLPRIYSMVREVFGGMTRAFPAMSASKQSRAVYGVDVMFEVTGDGGDDEADDGNGTSSRPMIIPKLTEVTFCPANNAICLAYERDEDLYRSYLNDVFNCLFRRTVSDNLTLL